MNLRTVTIATTCKHGCMFSAGTDQVVVRPNAEQFSEVTKGNGSVSLKTEVTVVMSWSQVTAFTEINEKETERQ